MTITWDEVGERVYETGVDHGILFLMDGTAVPWNGLTQVALNVSGGDLEEYYFDGVKYMDYVLAEEFDATVTAVTSPKEFAACEGVVQVKPGMSTPFQKREKFNLCWRTRIANDLDENVGYKLHLAYNCTVLPSARTYATISDTTSPDIRSWGVKTTPACGRISYYVFDSREVDLSALEAELYSGNLPYCGSLASLVGAATDDSDCAVLIEAFDQFVNGEEFNPTVDLTDGLTETFLFGIVNPGVDEVDLPATGTFTVNDSAATETGSGSILDDDDDTTHVDSAEGDLGYTIGLPPLAGYYPGADLELHIRMSITGSVDPDDPDNLDADAQVFITTDAAGDLPVGGFSDGTDDGMGFALTDVEGNATDYVVPLSMDAWTETTIDDVVAALQAGAYLNVVAVNNNNPDPAITPVVEVYEASVVMLDDTRIDKFLRADPDEIFCKIEQHIYETGTTDQEGANTTSVEFMVRRVPYSGVGDGWYQELIFWDGSGPALFKVDSNGGQPRLQLIDSDTSSVDVDFIPIQNMWYKAEIYWTWGSYSFKIFQDPDRVYPPGSQLPYVVTNDTSFTPIAFAEHIGGFVGESSASVTYEAVIDNAVLQTHCHETAPVEVTDTLYFKLSTSLPSPMAGSTLVGAADVQTALSDTSSASYVDIPSRDGGGSKGLMLSLVPKDVTAGGWTSHRLEIDYEVVGGGSCELGWELSAIDPLGGTMAEWNSPATFTGSGTLVEQLPVNSSVGFHGESDPGHWTVSSFMEEAALADTPTSPNVWFEFDANTLGQPHIRITGLRVVVSKFV